MALPEGGRDDDGGQLAPDHLVARPPEHALGGGVELGDASLTVHAHESVHGRFDHRAVPGLALEQDRLAALARRDVDHAPDHAHRATAEVEDEAAPIEHLEEPPVPRAEAILGDEVAPQRRVGLELPVDALAVVGVHVLDPPLVGRGDLVEPVGRDLGEARRPHHRPAPKIPVVDRGADRGGGELEAFVGQPQPPLRGLHVGPEPARRGQRAGLQQRGHEREHADQQPAAEHPHRHEPVRHRVEGGERREVQGPSVTAEVQRDGAIQLAGRPYRTGGRVAIVEQVLGPHVAVVELEIDRLAQGRIEEHRHQEVGAEGGRDVAREGLPTLLDALGRSAAPVDRHEDDEPGAAVAPQQSEPVAHRGQAGVPRTRHRAGVLRTRGDVEPEHARREALRRLEERSGHVLGALAGRMDLVAGHALAAHQSLVRRASGRGDARRPPDAADALVATLETQSGHVGVELGALDRGAAREQGSHAEQDLDVGIEASVDGLAAHRHEAIEALLLVGAHRALGVAPDAEGQQQRAREDDVRGPSTAERIDERRWRWAGDAGGGSGAARSGSRHVFIRHDSGADVRLDSTRSCARLQRSCASGAAGYTVGGHRNVSPLERSRR